ncbi:MAG: glucose 1-dehydrogenase [Xanthomonadales bacterium]|nr:SDR family oxidoreductase [Xanthomonadales bacterium]NIX12287.1 glucose 1-dehydrogenase [Xanthomonadales bacterium]
MRGLKGRKVMVTGGASGIGQATAARFLEEGCTVCVMDRDPAACERVGAELPGLTGVIEADVADSVGVQAAVREAIRLMGAIDVLINNAGISFRHDFLEITEKDWDQVLGVNLKGVFLVAQAVARHMSERGSGVILNTASTAGTTGYPHYADYSASKGGVIALTYAMALELAPAVRVNAISPGYVLTPMQRAEYSDEMLDAVNRKIPMGRHAKPEEIAALFAFLASDDAGFATGQVYVMDGAETTGGLCSQWHHE